VKKWACPEERRILPCRNGRVQRRGEPSVKKWACREERRTFREEVGVSRGEEDPYCEEVGVSRGEEDLL
jgi:hypothetical protein